MVRHVDPSLNGGSRHKRPWWTRPLLILAIGIAVTLLSVLLFRGRGFFLFLPFVFFLPLTWRRRD